MKISCVGHKDTEYFETKRCLQLKPYDTKIIIVTVCTHLGIHRRAPLPSLERLPPCLWAILKRWRSPWYIQILAKAEIASNTHDTFNDPIWFRSTPMFWGRTSSTRWFRACQMSCSCWFNTLIWLYLTSESNKKQYTEQASPNACKICAGWVIWSVEKDKRMHTNYDQLNTIHHKGEGGEIVIK